MANLAMAHGVVYNHEINQRFQQASSFRKPGSACTSRDVAVCLLSRPAAGVAKLAAGRWRDWQGNLNTCFSTEAQTTPSQVTLSHATFYLVVVAYLCHSLDYAKETIS